MHTFFCPNCGKRFDREESLAGRKARCKDCQHVFVIPAAADHRTAHAARSQPGPSSARSANLAPNRTVDDPYEIEETPSLLPVPYGEAEPGADSDALPHTRRSGPVKKKARRTGGNDFAWVGPLTLGGIGLEVVLLLLFGTFTYAGFSTAAAVIISIMGIVYTAMLVTGSILCCVVPFFESVMHGLLYLFVPFYSLYYLITRWPAMKRPFTLLLSVSVLPIAAALFLPAIQAARQAALRAQEKQQTAASDPEFAASALPAPAPEPAPAPPATPAPPSPAPTNGITLELTMPAGIDGQTALAMGRKIGQRVGVIARELDPGVFQLLVGRRGDLLTATITPMRDPQAFADRINFGTVTAVRGRIISVTVTPEGVALLPDFTPGAPRPVSGTALPARPVGPRRVLGRPPIGSRLGPVIAAVFRERDHETDAVRAVGWRLAHSQVGAERLELPPSLGVIGHGELPGLIRRRWPRHCAERNRDSCTGRTRKVGGPRMDVQFLRMRSMKESMSFSRISIGIW
jgi:hypothetical protein